MFHKLKIDRNYLSNLVDGSKTCEIMVNDRDYQKGDGIVFTEYFEGTSTKKHIFKITHIHSGIGMLPGYVVLSLENKGFE